MTTSANMVKEDLTIFRAINSKYESKPRTMRFSTTSNVPTAKMARNACEPYLSNALGILSSLWNKPKIFSSLFIIFDCISPQRSFPQNSELITINYVNIILYLFQRAMFTNEFLLMAVRAEFTMKRRDFPHFFK